MRDEEKGELGGGTGVGEKEWDIRKRKCGCGKMDECCRKVIVVGCEVGLMRYKQM